MIKHQQRNGDCKMIYQVFNKFNGECVGTFDTANEAVDYCKKCHIEVKKKIDYKVVASENIFDTNKNDG